MNSTQQRAFRNFLGSTVHNINQSYLKRNTTTCIKLPNQFYDYVNSSEFSEILETHNQRCIRGKWNAYTANTENVQLVQYTGIYYIEYKHRYLSKKQAKHKFRQKNQSYENVEQQKSKIGYLPASYSAQQMDINLIAFPGIFL